jgi:hypothetical protein
LTLDREIVGTLRYVSPEQVLAVVPPDRRSDVYSLGVVLWELLTLRPIFDDGPSVSTNDLMRRIVSSDADSIRKSQSFVSADLDAIVHKCLEKDPSHRFQTAAELAEDLSRALEGEPVRARQVGMVERGLRWLKRRKTAIALAVSNAAFVILAAGLVLWMVTHTRVKPSSDVGEESDLTQRAASGSRSHNWGDTAVKQSALPFKIRPYEGGPSAAGDGARRRALLVGVTRYDHLPRERHLEGPANDVRLMRRLLCERYQFPAEGIVVLIEDQGSTPAGRPTRTNIEREFHRLAASAREGDQVVILLAGHGSRQPERYPPDPDDIGPDAPDGMDVIFLPADVGFWGGERDRLSSAIADKEVGAWIRAIIVKGASVWAIYDFSYSCTMTRSPDLVREVPPETLVPREALEKARSRANRRPEFARGSAWSERTPFVPLHLSDRLVATYACRLDETASEGLQPPGSPDAEPYGLLSYSLADILLKSAESKESLTYRELGRRLQSRYAGRPQGSPTPLVEGRGQERIVLTEHASQSLLRLTREEGKYRVNAGDLSGLTPGSILAVESATEADGKRQLLGHARIRATRPYDATVEPCAYEGSPVISDLALSSVCRLVFRDLRPQRFKIAVQAPSGRNGLRQELTEAIRPLADSTTGLDVVQDPRQADWLLRKDGDLIELSETSGYRSPIRLRPDVKTLSDALRAALEKIHRARNLVALANEFETCGYRADAAVDIDVDVLQHKSRSAPGEVARALVNGWVFRPGNYISFRVHNKSKSARIFVTLLVIGSDFEITVFYPKATELGVDLAPGKSLDTPPPPGEISDEPPFGPEALVVIASAADNAPMDFAFLHLGGAGNRIQDLRSPFGELLESVVFRNGTRRGLTPAVIGRYAMRVRTWTTDSRESTKSAPSR